MVIAIINTSLPKLIAYCAEKEKEGYKYVDRIKVISSYRGDCDMSLHKRFDYTGNSCGIKFKVAMRKKEALIR